MWFLDVENLEICGPVNREESTQRELLKEPEMQNYESHNIMGTRAITTAANLTKEERNSREMIKKILTEE